jgi:hypothetical protein
VWICGIASDSIVEGKEDMAFVVLIDTDPVLTENLLWQLY